MTPVTWEMVYRFQAADDTQADRLAHAWAGTINAEFGCELVEVRKVVDDPSPVQVGWYGPYGIIPGGMDNEPMPKWRPIYVLR